jgi:hypothetical protein
MRQLPREVLAELVKLVSNPPGQVGRPKGSGSKDDSLALDRMADLRVAKGIKSERKASTRVAEELGSANVETDARRFRRKYAENRAALEGAALERLQAELARQAAARSQGRATGEEARSRPPGTGARSSGGVPPLSDLDFVVAALKDIQRQYGLAREVYESLCQPFVLEQIARDAERLPEAVSSALETIKWHPEDIEAQVRAITTPSELAKRVAAEARFQPKHMVTSLGLDFGAKLHRAATEAHRVWEEISHPPLHYQDEFENLRQQLERMMNPFGSR